MKKFYLAKDKHGVFVFREKPIWLIHAKEFFPDDGGCCRIDDSFGESLQVGQYAEIVDVTLGKIQTHGKVK